MKPSPQQHDFVERVARWWESISGSRSAGRIVGWLMICDPPHRSAPQLIDDLELSSGSVSTQTTVLEHVGFVERVTFPGDRASYYRLPDQVWVNLMRSEEQRMIELRQLASAARSVLPVERPDRVEDLDRIAEFFLARWPALMSGLGEMLESGRTS